MFYVVFSRQVHFLKVLLLEYFFLELLLLLLKYNINALVTPSDPPLILPSTDHE